MRFILGLLFGACLTHFAFYGYQGKPLFQFHAADWQNFIQYVQAALSDDEPGARKNQHEPTVYDAGPIEHIPPVHTASVAPEADPEPELEPELAPIAQADLTAGRQVVWTPFHSEASANGFAGRLNTVLGQRFEVEKLAPQTYVVTFNYNSEPERTELEAQVNALTGGPTT